MVKKLKSAGTVAINFGGGECPLRRDFIPLCKYIAENSKIKISLTTNGTTFSLIKHNLNLFHDIGVSLDFPDARRHDWFRGVNGTFKKATETIKKLVENGVKVEIVTCITKLNSDIKTLEKMYELCKKLRVDSWRINRYRPTGREEMIEKLRLDKETLKKVYQFLASLSMDTVSISDPIFRAYAGIKGAFAGCPCGTYSFRIQPDGEVSPCIYLKESGGNIKEKAIDEIMNSEIFKRIRERNPRGKCINCSIYQQCKGGCAGSSYLEYGHFDGPDPLCFLQTDEVKSTEIFVPKKWNVHELYLCTVYVPIHR